MQQALVHLERVRVEVSEAMDCLDPVTNSIACQVEGLLLGASMGVDYAVEHLEEFLKDAPVAMEMPEQFTHLQMERIQVVRLRTDAAASDCLKYLREANWDVEQATTALRRKGQASG